MKHHRLAAALALACAGMASAPALADPAACADQDARLTALSRAAEACFDTRAVALAGSSLSPAAAAEEALTACAAERTRLTDHARICFKVADTMEGFFRERVSRDVARRRLPRADRVWLYKEAWGSGACSLDNPAFRAEVQAHVDCLVERADTRSFTEAGMVARAVPACRAEEAPLARRLAACPGPQSASDLFAAYLVAAQETAVADLMVHADRRDITGEPPPAEARARGAFDAYAACVMVEAHRRRPPGPPVVGEARAAILAEAVRVCAGSRDELVTYAAALDEAAARSLVEHADSFTDYYAGLELDVLPDPPARP